MPTFLSPLLHDPAGRYCLQNARTELVVAARVITAFDSASRRKGLLGRDSFPNDSALIIAPGNAIHTWFMRFPIDVAFVAKDGRVVKTRLRVGPWRIAAALGAYAVIELAGGALERSGTVAGDQIVVVRDSSALLS